MKLWDAMLGWSKEHPARFAISVIFTVAMVVVMMAWATFTKNHPESTGYSESEILLETATEIVEDSPVLTITPEPDTPTPTEIVEESVTVFDDNVQRAVIRVVSCDNIEGCMVPIWQTHEREKHTGRVLQGSTVSVVGCYYPVVQQPGEATPEPGEPPVLEHAEYVLEGLWCEVVGENIDGETVKGLLQYWFLEFDEGFE